jgi:hypothetical protein
VRLSLPSATLSAVLVHLAAASWADTQWLDDVRVSNQRPGTDRIVLDANKDNSALYVHVSGNQVGEHVGWLRSIDNGATWQNLLDATWTVADKAIGAAYGFGTLVQVWEHSNNVLYRTIDATTGAALFNGIIVNEAPRIAKEIIVDSNAETGPAGDENFIACAKLLDPGTNEVTLKVYRSTNHGSTWGNFATLDSGPPGDPNYIGDVHMAFSFAGFPFFHVVYVRSGRIWHVRTTNAGVSWSAPAMTPVGVTNDSEVSLAAFGVSVIAVGQVGAGPGYQVVYCNTTDAGVTWSASKLLDDVELGARLPSATCREGLNQIVYRKSDGHLAYRFTASFNPNPGNWSAEQYATQGTTDLPAFLCGLPAGTAAVAYVRPDDNGYPYFASKAGAPITAVPGLPPVPVALLAVFPSPASGPVRVLYSMTEASPGPGVNPTGSVIDMSGRVIAPLTAWRLVGSGSEATWDGRDAAGRRVPAGIYVVRVEAPPGTLSSRVAIVR